MLCFALFLYKNQEIRRINKGERKERSSRRWGIEAFYFSVCGEFAQKSPSDPRSAEHIPAGWNQNPLWIILNIHSHILPWALTGSENVPLTFSFKTKIYTQFESQNRHLQNLALQFYCLSVCRRIEWKQMRGESNSKRQRIQEVDKYG